MMDDELNANEGTKKNGLRECTESEIKYGWFNIRPGCMQLMLKPLVCLLTLIGCSSTQGELGGRRRRVGGVN